MATRRALALGQRLTQAVRAEVGGTPFATAGEVAALARAQAARGGQGAKAIGRDGRLFFTLGESVVGGEDVVAVG